MEVFGDLLAVDVRLGGGFCSFRSGGFIVLGCELWFPGDLEG